MALPAAADFIGSSITEAQFKTAMVALVEYLEDLETITPGLIAYFPRTTAPSGWLKANGAAISRTTYASLFAAIGVTFGTGDGTTTFNLPDLRGEFVRGLDDSRGVDSGRVLGSAQADQNKAHTHSMTFGDYASGPTPIGNVGGSGPPLSTASFTSSSDGGTESRPRNIALLACIKY